MIDQAVISQLKQINVSKDAEKTKERVSELWKASDSKQKKKIIELGSSNTSSIYRVTRLGNVSIKIVLAFSQICNVNPYYLSGETDEFTECSNTLINNFMTDHGYGKLIVKRSKKQAREVKRQNSINRFSENNIISIEDDHCDNDMDNPLETNDIKLIEDQNEVVDFQNIHKDSDDLVLSLVNLFCQKQYEMTDTQISIIQTLPLEDVEYLLKALSIKSKAGGNASIIYKIIKLLLIS